MLVRYIRYNVQLFRLTVLRLQGPGRKQKGKVMMMMALFSSSSVCVTPDLSSVYGCHVHVSPVRPCDGSVH